MPSPIILAVSATMGFFKANTPETNADDKPTNEPPLYAAKIPKFFIPGQEGAGTTGERLLEAPNSKHTTAFPAFLNIP